MKSPDKSGSSLRPKIINLNRPKTTKSALKKPRFTIQGTETLKNKIDSMLRLDYADWNSNPNNFNALNSSTARNFETIQQYIHKVYLDYQIPDPLFNAFPKKSFIPLPNQFEASKNLPQPRQTYNSPQKVTFAKPPEFIRTENINPYITPVKNSQNYLDSTYSINYQQRLFTDSKKKQDLINFYPNDQTREYSTKINFFERTAPSLQSLVNSRNETFTPNKFDRSGAKSDQNNNERVIQSRLSLASRLQDQKGKDRSFQRLEQFDQTSISKFKQPLQTERTQKAHFSLHQFDQSQKINTIQRTFQTNRLRYQFKNQSDQLYAEKILKNFQIQNVETPVLSNKNNQHSFKYCIGCEEPILDANVDLHSNQCTQFKKILNNQSKEEILAQIDKKISAITLKINQRALNVNQKDQEIILESSKIIIKFVQALKDKNIKAEEGDPVDCSCFDEQYRKIMNIGTNWGLLTEEVNKLKWFLMVKNNFTKMQTQKQ